MTFVFSTVSGDSCTFQCTAHKHSSGSGLIDRSLGHVARVLFRTGTSTTRGRGCCRLVVGYIGANVVILSSGNIVCRAGGRTLHLLKLTIFAGMHRLTHVSRGLGAIVRGVRPNSGRRVSFAGRHNGIRLSVHISRVALRSGRMHVLTVGSVGDRLSSGRVSS